MFDAIDDDPIPDTEIKHNELDRYLAADRQLVKDPLKWWHKHQDVYPILSRMARDYLSIPRMFPCLSL